MERKAPKNMLSSSHKMVGWKGGAVACIERQRRNSPAGAEEGGGRCVRGRENATRRVQRKNGDGE